MSIQTIASEHPVRRVGRWMLLALLISIASTGCATIAQPQESGQGQAEPGLHQDAPPTRTLEVIDVDLNAVQPLPKSLLESDTCPKLEGPLNQIVASADPAQTAQALGMPVRDNQVQVTLVLDGTSTAFLEQAGIQIGKQVGQEVQAYVPISRLCELAAHQSILVIRPVSQAEPQ